MLEPGLKVASAGLNHRTRFETIRRQFRERNLVEIVEGGKAMMPEAVVKGELRPLRNPADDPD